MSRVLIELSIGVINNEIQVKNHYSDFLYVPDLAQIVVIQDEKQSREACPASLNSSLVDLILKPDLHKFSFADIYNSTAPVLVLLDLASKLTYRIPLRKVLSEADLLKRLETVGYNESAPNKLHEEMTSLESKVNSKINDLEAKIKQFNADYSNSVDLKNYENDLQKIESEIIDLANSYNVNVEINEQDPSIASIIKYVPTEIDIKYESLPGEDYCCKGIVNGCTIGTVYGNNPYTTDSKYCSAALHAGLINETGGVFHVKKLGKYQGYEAVTRNGVTTLKWDQWDGLSFHRSNVELLAHSIFDVCGKYTG